MHALPERLAAYIAASAAASSIEALVPWVGQMATPMFCSVTKPRDGCVGIWFTTRCRGGADSLSGGGGNDSLWGNEGADRIPGDRHDPRQQEG